MPLNEANTCAQLIDPKLKAANWVDTRLTCEQHYNRDPAYTADRIRLRCDRTSHGQPRRINYLLRYADTFPIAIVEAKAEDGSAEAGLVSRTGVKAISSIFPSAMSSLPPQPTTSKMYWLSSTTLTFTAGTAFYHLASVRRLLQRLGTENRMAGEIYTPRPHMLRRAVD